MILVLWVFLWLRKEKWQKATITNVISFKPLYSDTCHLVQYTTKDDTLSNEFITLNIPRTHFEFKKLSKGKIIFHV